MMKNLLYRILFVVIILAAAPGCDNFLAEKPRDIISPGNFFKSDAEAKTAVNGIYRIYHNNAYGNVPGMYHFYEYGADVVGPNREWGAVQAIQNYTINEGNIGRGTWRNLYKVIQNANLIISRITDNESMTEAGRNQRIGETLFLRALAYYHLTNLWGDVPYYRDNLPLDEVRNLGRTDKTQIRQDLVQDLKRAADLLPSTYPESELGRATKWAAKTLLVKIDLWLENWQEARDVAVEIINNSPHKLLENYADIFDPNNEYNDEVIFQMVYAKDLLNQRFTDNFTPRIRDEPKEGANRGALQDSLAANSQGFTGYGLAIPLPDLVNRWPDDDLRKKASIVTELYGYELKFPYFRKLWNLDQINSPRGNHGDNFIVFRLADVYLMAAEAENELNGPANAYQYINKVRERAFEPDQPLSGLTQQQFRAVLYDERKWELAAEGHRRIDLIRWGILEDVVRNTEYRVYDPVSNFEAHNVLLPISIEEIELNPALLESDPTNNGYR